MLSAPAPRDMELMRRVVRSPASAGSARPDDDGDASSVVKWEPNSRRRDGRVGCELPVAAASRDLCPVVVVVDGVASESLTGRFWKCLPPRERVAPAGEELRDSTNDMVLLGVVDA
jgi:hypothetical protein